ncbi:VanR-ABDEGLN family response regulator transcription factor [Miniphocaeibacter massiliensis]|uniref:VanR-ABDEGLN family response regulator transcription factor n=1 Tax=Miniphocaeibacter massiliensis TaxID=2041841 RepID=UPI000C1BB04D|nr:VanR-ABDEGLN family response regulator transcription factor [Miniphocaeibacter massiliensis]
MKENILIVDDEKEITDLVEIYLKNEGFNVFKFYNGKDAINCIKNENLDLAVLDIMLPDIDGFSLCQSIRKEYLFPVIFLTAKIEDGDKIMGLTFGADDYMTKPFNPLELVARIKTQLRRYKQYNKIDLNNEKNIYDKNGLFIDSNTRKVNLNNKPLDLTPIEFDILWHLAKNSGKVVSSEDLFEKVWKEKYLNNNNTVMTHIARLREKMKEPSRKPKYIKTVWGVGYTIE